MRIFQYIFAIILIFFGGIFALCGGGFTIIGIIMFSREGLSNLVISIPFLLLGIGVIYSARKLFPEKSKNISLEKEKDANIQ